MMRASDRGPGPIASGLIYYYLTGNIVALGVFLGTDFLEPSLGSGHKFDYGGEAYANWDGQWYKKIAIDGYGDAPDARSRVAFFPGYPLLGGALSKLVGIKAEVALLIVSNVCLAALFCLTAKYVSLRYPEDTTNLTGYVLLALGLVPTTFFFRMAYTESLFLLLTALVLYGMIRQWPVVVIALVVGAATATRPVGVGLIPVLMLHVWHRSRFHWAFLARAAILSPIACWGIAAYMGFLYLELDDPLAFAHAQDAWQLRPPSSLVERLLSLATLEPIWSMFDPTSPGYRSMREHHALFSLRLVDPLFFLGAVALTATGAFKRWLSDYEIITALFLLLIPYTTNGYEQYMRSMGRYASAAFPVYFVLGHLLSRIPAPLVSAFAGLSGFLLGAFSALFAAWYLFI